MWMKSEVQTGPQLEYVLTNRQCEAENSLRYRSGGHGEQESTTDRPGLQQTARIHGSLWRYPKFRFDLTDLFKEEITIGD
jgi:hypothetical protein